MEREREGRWSDRERKRERGDGEKEGRRDSGK